MKFSCTKENLYRALSLISHIAAKNTHLPILHNVLLEAKEEAIYVTATNLEIGVRAVVRGKVEKTGALTVPAQILCNYIGLVDADRIDVEQQEKDLAIHAGNQQTKMRGEAAQEFPLIPEVERTNAITIPARELKEALQQTLVAVSHDDSRPELSGILVKQKENQLIFASTDSYRLAEKKIPLTQHKQEQAPVIIPGSVLQELVRIIPDIEDETVDVYFNDNQALFKTSLAEVTASRLIDGTFPDYEQIIPQQEQTKAVVGRQEFIQSIKAASLFSKSGIHDINLHFSPEKQEITVTTVNNQIGENVTKIPAEITGDSNNTIFNFRYMLDGVAQIPTEKLVLRLIDNVSPGVFRPFGESEQNYIYIVMPIKH